MFSVKRWGVVGCVIKGILVTTLKGKLRDHALLRMKGCMCAKL